MLSYATAEEAAADRDMQRSLLVALDASKRSLKSGRVRRMAAHG